MPTGILPSFGRPGVGPTITAQKLNVSRDGELTYFPGGGVIEGSKSRDPGNSASSVRTLRAGLLMGKLSTGYYAPSIIGTLTGAVSASGTSVTISAASAVELVRRGGSTGTLRFVGPPTANGTVATFTETYSAVNTTTGVVTVSGLDADLVAGSFLVLNDGTYLPKSFIADGYGIVIPEDDADVNFPWIPVAGVIDVANIIDWPTDTSLQAWIRTNLSTASGGKFVFSDQF